MGLEVPFALFFSSWHRRIISYGNFNFLVLLEFFFRPSATKAVLNLSPLLTVAITAPVVMGWAELLFLLSNVCLPN